MDGIERLEAEVLEINDCNISAIFDYLKTKQELYEKFNNEEKSIKQMYQFIYGKAKKLAKNNVAMVGDKVVYIWAMTYFNKTNQELGIEEKKVMPPSVSEVIKKEAEKKAKAEEKPKDDQISMFEEVKE